MKRAAFLFLVSISLLLKINNIYPQDFWQQSNGPGGGITVLSLASSPNGYIFAGTEERGIYRSSDYGEIWVKINNDLTNFNVTKLAIDSNGYIFAATNYDDPYEGTYNEYIFRSTDNGDSWVQLNNELIIVSEYSRISDLVTGSNGYVFVESNEGGIFRSTNYGDNWTPLNFWAGALTINLDGFIFGISDGGVVRSTDNGDTWIEADSLDPSLSSLAISPAGYIFAASGYHGIFRSTDYGYNWVEINNGLPVDEHGYLRPINILAINPVGHIFAISDYNEIFHSTDNGDNWVHINGSLPYDFPIRAIVIPANSFLLVGGGEYGNHLASKGIFRSTDDGNSWTQTNSGLNGINVLSIALNSSGDVFAGTYGVGMFRLINNSNTWSSINNGINFFAYFPNYISSLAINSSGQIFSSVLFEDIEPGIWPVGIFRSTDNGDTWNDLGVGGPIAINSAGDLFVGVRGGILRSTDNGENWIPKDIFGSYFPDYIPDKIIITPDNHIFAMITYESYYYYSTNNGDSWSYFNAPEYTTCITENSDGDIFTGTNREPQGIFRSSDDGATWVQINEGLDNLNIHDLIIDSENHIYAGTSGGVFRSANNGDSWIEVSGGVNPIYVNCLALDNWEHLYAGNGEGVFRSIESTTPVELTSFNASVSDRTVLLTWQTATETNNYGFEIERSLVNPQSEIRNPKWEMVGFVKGNGTTSETKSYSFYDNNLAQSKYSYRLKQLDYDGSFKYSRIVDVEINPGKYELAQNYPNPFNPSTAISYSIPITSFVTLKVYDVLGNEVAVLVNEEMTAGSYKISFDGSSFSSGIYFYKMETGGFTSIKKLVLLK